MNKKALKRLENAFLFFGVLAWLLFLIGMRFNSADYFEQIDLVNQEGYSPFSHKHILSLFVFFILGYFSLYKVSTVGRKLPPLQVVIYVAFIIIALVLATFMMIQVTFYSNSEDFPGNTFGLPFFFAPFFFWLLSIIILQKFVNQERIAAKERRYKNKWLNRLNDKMIQSGQLSIWAIIIILPILLLITLILILFGQDADSLVKVFTETTTWTFSEKTHPPYLDHKGHYLCTVAACGSPKIVKPQRLGIRHGTEIIVNRQLMIANAFEELISDKSPRFHRWLRKNYDKYGYPLSKRITSKKWSNTTYILMKPFEWFFLLSLYLFSSHPEKKINRQYAWTK